MQRICAHKMHGIVARIRLDKIIKARIFLGVLSKNKIL